MKVLTLFVVIIPRPALCGRSLVDSIKDRDAGICKVLEEVDPKDVATCERQKAGSDFRFWLNIRVGRTPWAMPISSPLSFRKSGLS